MFFNPGNVSNSGNGGTGGSGDGHTHSNLSTLNKVTESKFREWDNKSNFSGNYNDLTNKPTIPTVDVTKVYVDSEVSKKADKTHSHSEYATPSYVQEKIAEASLSGGEVDLSAYATKAELNTKADKSHTHNELHSHSNKTVLDGITSSKVNEWNNKSTFNGDYNSLTNKPVIPSTEGLATESYVQAKIAEASLSGGEVDLSAYATIAFVEQEIEKIELTPGPQGPQGLQGLKGDKGEVGPQGLQGPKGDKGDTGAQGPQGLQGLKGDTGKTGPQGLKGDTGPIGPQGPKGDQGDIGPIGLTGPKGDTGAKGAKGDKGKDGITYTPSVDSSGNLSWTNNGGLSNPTTVNIKGAKGDTGPQGPKGLQGPKGERGLQGIQGVQGPKGDKGDPGTTSWNDLQDKPNIPSIEGLATEAFVEEKLAGLGSQPETLVQVIVTGNTLQLTKDKYQYSVLSSGNGISLPSVSSFAEIHLFFKTTSEITLVLPSVRWQTQPTIQANKTYEFIFTYVKDEWLGGVVEYV